MDISHPHDTFFRLIVSKVKRTMDLIHHQISPQVTKHLIFDTMTSEPDTFVDSHLKNHYSDALFKVQTHSGTPAYLYLLMDHKSFPDPDIILQLQRYMNRIWERCISNSPGSILPPIIGIVLYHGTRPWNIETEFKSRFDCPEEFTIFIPDFRYVLIDLSIMNDDDILGGADLKAALMLMKYILHPNLRGIVPEILKVLKKARHQADFPIFFEAFMLYLLKYLDQDYHEELEKLIQIELPEEGEKIMPTVADKLRQEGLQEGLQKGLQKGQLSVITRLLHQKFGAIDPVLTEQLQQLSDTQVEDLTDSFFEFHDLSDFKKWLQDQQS